MRTLNVLILIAFAANTALTFLSITGVYGHTNSELSRKYQSLTTPAGWAFSIWGIIFTLQTAFAVAQLFPAFAKADEVSRAGPWFIAACLFQASWSVAFGFAKLYLAQGLIFAILASLVRTNMELRSVARDAPPGWARYLLCHLPFTIHFGWLTAASVVGANLTLVATSPSAHSALLAAAIVSLTIVLLPALVNPATDNDPGYALTIAWAFAGVAAQLRSPLPQAPEADPIPSWAPMFVTDALGFVATALSALVLLSVVARALSALVKRKAERARPLAEALVTKW